MSFKPTHIFRKNIENIDVTILRKGETYFKCIDSSGLIWFSYPGELQKIKTTVKDKMLRAF